MVMRKLVRRGIIALIVSGITGTASAESINQALANAYSNNPTLASSFLDVRAARQRILEAEGARLPTIGAGASVGYTWSDGPQGSRASDSIGLDYTQTLYDSNQTGAAILAAEAGYDAEVQGARNTEQNVLLSSVQAYVDVISTRRIVDIRQENIGFVRAQVQSSQDSLDLGEGTRLDVAQAEASLAQAEAASASAVNNLRIAEANYERWIGHPPRNLTGGYTFASLVPASLDQALERAISQHPALLASTARIAAAQYGAEQTRARFGPSLTLNGSVGTGGFTSSTGNLTSEASISLRLSVPIFSPTRDPVIEQANIGQIQSQLEGFATRDQIVEAVRQSWAGIQSSTSQIESATAAVAASRLALQAVVDQNEVGQATTLDVLNARANLLQVEESLVSAQSQRTIAGYSLLASVGVLSAQSLGLPVQPRTADGAAVKVPGVPADPWGNLR